MTTRNLLALALAAPLLLASGVAMAAGDAEHGEKVFRKCKVCHDLEKDKASKKQGPNLYGVIGRTSGTLKSFEERKGYSDAMKEAGIVWDEKTLDEYLADPKAKVPHNKMPFNGLKKEKDRQDVIAYIEHENEEDD